MVSGIFRGVGLEIIVLDKDYQELGSITSFEGLRWSRKLKEPGNYELLILNKYLDLIFSGEHLVIDQKDETGLIGAIDYDKTKKKVKVTGRFIEQKLNDRVIAEKQDLYNYAEDVMRAVILPFCSGERVLPLLELGQNNHLGDLSQIQIIPGQTLLSKIYEIANMHNLGVKLDYDYVQNKLIFKPWKGKDRTSLQTENSLAEFTENEGNVLSVSYYQNRSDYKNFAYVEGKNGDESIIITVDNRIGDEPLKEIWIDASDIQYTAVEITIPNEQLAAAKTAYETKDAEYKQIQSRIKEIEAQRNTLLKKYLDDYYKLSEGGMWVEERDRPLAQAYDAVNLPLMYEYNDLYAQLGPVSQTAMAAKANYDTLKLTAHDTVYLDYTEYKETLRTKGKERLSEHRIIETVLFEVDGNSNLIYKEDYDLGDKVTFQDAELGISADLIITEITEIFEKNTSKILLTLGDENKTEVEKIKKGVL